MPRPTVAPARRLNLRHLVRHILDRAPSPEEGQLDVYRVFLRVDPELLRRAGVTTLRFDEDKWIDDAELLGRLERAFGDSLGAHLPAEAWS